MGLMDTIYIVHTTTWPTSPSGPYVNQHLLVTLIPVDERPTLYGIPDSSIPTHKIWPTSQSNTTRATTVIPNMDQALGATQKKCSLPTLTNSLGGTLLITVRHLATRKACQGMTRGPHTGTQLPGSLTRPAATAMSTGCKRDAARRNKHVAATSSVVSVPPIVTCIRKGIELDCELCAIFIEVCVPPAASIPKLSFLEFHER
jgi:hypothetical protein